jgi:hypothetical protein
MKKSISFGLTLLIIPFLLAQNILAIQEGIKVSSKSGEKLYLYKDYHALVVGVGDYDFWPDLQGAVKDAKELAEYLKLSDMNVSLVLNPNSRELKETLNKLTYEIGREKDRAILFFYSGHGETETLTTEEKLGYIVPKDCPTIGQDYMGFAEKAISMNQIETYALRIRSKHVLMVFDSCFSGSVFASLKGVPTDISEKSNRPVRQFITAGNENEQVPDESVFKTCFIQGLDGEADYNKDGYVTGSELGMYLDTSVVNYSRGSQHPQYGKIRHPKLDKGDFVFAKSKTDELVFYKLKAKRLEKENEMLRQQLASAKPEQIKKEISVESQKQKIASLVIERDSHFQKNANGVVLDTKTGLEWYAGPDKATTWYEAERWVKNLSLSNGQWRLPTIKELKTLYQKSDGTRNMTPLLITTGWRVWSSEREFTYYPGAWYFSFRKGFDERTSDDNASYLRGFAVRYRR